MAALVCGCSGVSGPERDTEDGTTGDAEPPPEPVFTEPASGRIDVPASRVEDVAIGVAGIVPGNTLLFVDGLVRGESMEGDPLGTLDGDALTIRLRGAMVPSVHLLQLSNSGGDEPLLSSVLEAHVLPVDAPPTLVVEASGATRPGRAVVASGAGATSLLAVLDDTAPQAPVLAIAPLGDDGWDLDSARTIAIPGYRREPGERGLAVAVARVGPIGEPAERLRVAWRVDDPGTAIHFVDTSWADPPDAPAAWVAFDLDPDVLGPYEHAELGRPAIAGDTIVAEAIAATDVESPRPGDRMLVQARLSGVPAVVTDASRVTIGDRQDLDAIGPVLDARNVEIGGPPLLGARLDRRVPIVFEVDPVHGRLALRPSRDDGRSRALSGVVGPLSMVVGALGSRRVVGHVPGDPGRMRLVEIDDYSGGDVREHSLAADALPDPDDATGDAAVVAIAGFAVWLVPYGSDAPVHAIVTGTETPTVQPLDDLHCDQIAAAFDPREPGGGREVALACASGGGEITTARLSANTDG